MQSSSADTGSPGSSHRKPGSSQPDASAAAYFQQGRAIYNFRCYFCHGYSGNAHTLAASFMSPKPRDFTHSDPARLTRVKMIDAVTHGRKGTAMKSFARTLKPQEIGAVVDFVRKEFMQGKAINTRYHTAANGWPNHERYKAAYPFALGKIAIDTPDTSLTPEQRAGKRLFMSSCVSCHDRAKVKNAGVIWDREADSYPQNNVTPALLAQQLRARQAAHPKPDSTSGASIYARHDIAPKFIDLTAQQREGESLFQHNCAFCHAADGTAKNWIGSFLQPHPRNLTDASVMSAMTPRHVRQVIRDGLKGTTMSAWKSVLTEAQINAIIAYIQRAFSPLAAEPK